MRSTIACTTLSRPTSSGLTKCVMPNFLAIGTFDGLMSTPMILSAPTMLRALDDVEPDAAEAEDHDIRARPDLGGIDHRADAGGDAAADVADLVERRVLADLGERDLRQHGVSSRRSSSPCSGRRGLPSCEKRDVPSGIRPLPWVARIAVHRLERCERQVLQLRHSGV